MPFLSELRFYFRKLYFPCLIKSILKTIDRLILENGFSEVVPMVEF